MSSVEGCSLALSSGTSTDARSEVDLPAVVEAYSGLLFRVAHSVLRSRAEAEDVVQDVFVRVLKHRGSLLAVRDMRVWLVRIAWNLALDRKRRARPEQMEESFVEGLVARGLPADVAMEEAERMRSVLREIERLPKGERAVLLLAAIEELGTKEMAEVLGRSESAVRALLSRARGKLSERMEQVERTEAAGRRRQAGRREVGR